MKRKPVTSVLLLFALFALSAGNSKAQEAGIPAGTAMPGTQISLAGSGGSTTLGAQRGKVATVVVFWSNRCPWGSKLESRLVRYVQRYAPKGVVVLIVNSNDPGAFPKEGPAENASTGERLGVSVLGDATGKLADAFGATRNPAFFLFDANHTLVYGGNFDDSPGDESAVKSQYLDEATRVLVEGSGQAVPSTKAFGCRITPVRG
jgi:hypothetical protein